MVSGQEKNILIKKYIDEGLGKEEINNRLNSLKNNIKINKKKEKKEFKEEFKKLWDSGII